MLISEADVDVDVDDGVAPSEGNVILAVSSRDKLPK